MLLLLLGCPAPHEQLADTGEPVESVVDDTDDSSDSSDSDTDTDTQDSDSTVDSPVDTDPPCDPIRIYAVRHAEKESEGDDPGLTEEGLARAEALVPILEDAPLVAVYASEKLRTQLTVQPTADDHGLPVQTELDPEDELAEHILANHCGETLLHGGHSYTLEDFFEALGSTDVPDVSGYGQLWVLDIVEGEVLYEMETFGDE
ncbi:MAG: histidine phosphatase family protein [Proteobacteria bacterium]|nr:histidine phosphatase family protein [Pseudomonadota bacterium]MCP4918065.1 histidine phosphatase family protein [Pseudomonadota bacterium]